AAGTGKTYHTINHSLSILLNKTFEELDELYPDRAELKKIFDHYKEIGQIKFITFHQSFSYEDFVEGIRAEANDKGLSYDVKPGLFK
ncbi:restriction endonuclease, partial [Acinetobacter baumannii]